MKNFLRISAVCAFALMLISCGGGGSKTATTTTPPPPPPPPPNPLAVCLPATSTGTTCPTSQNVNIGGSQQFNATFNSAPATVTWSINGTVGGNASTGTITTGGLYTAPSPFPTPNAFTLTATLQSDTSKTSNVTLNVVYPNNNAQLQTAGSIEMGTTGGNVNDVVVTSTTKTCCSGTLGALISRGGVTYILSNNHVMARSDKGVVGENISQPGMVDNNCNPGLNTVAHLTEFAPLTPATSGGPAPKNVDAAIAQVVTAVVDGSGAILDLGAASGTSIAAAPPSNLGIVAPSLGLAVAKSGRSTSLTCGSISAINQTINVQYAASCGGPAAFTSQYGPDQIIIGGAAFSASGDSGSLIVDSTSSRPVGLLYAGIPNGGGTVAHPIGDVIAAFTSAAGTPAIVGAPSDHAVSCKPSGFVGRPTLNGGPSSVSSFEMQRAEAIQQRNGTQLMQNPAVTRVEVGASADNPSEAALILHLNSLPAQAVPATVEGMRTRLVLPEAVAQQAHLAIADVRRAIAVKGVHVDNLMSQPGIQGVGVTFSEDNPLEPAMLVLTVIGQEHAPIPATIDGLRTKVVEAEQVRAYNWGTEAVTAPAVSCGKSSRSAAPAINLRGRL
jgi:hypothetical protein